MSSNSGGGTGADSAESSSSDIFTPIPNWRPPKAFERTPSGSSPYSPRGNELLIARRRSATPPPNPTTPLSQMLLHGPLAERFNRGASDCHKQMQPSVTLPLMHVRFVSSAKLPQCPVTLDPVVAGPKPIDGPDQQQQQPQRTFVPFKDRLRSTNFSRGEKSDRSATLCGSSVTSQQLSKDAGSLSVSFSTACWRLASSASVRSGDGSPMNNDDGGGGCRTQGQPLRLPTYTGTQQGTSQTTARKQTSKLSFKDRQRSSVSNNHSVSAGEEGSGRDAEPPCNESNTYTPANALTSNDGGQQKHYQRKFKARVQTGALAPPLPPGAPPLLLPGTASPSANYVNYCCHSEQWKDGEAEGTELDNTNNSSERRRDKMLPRASSTRRGSAPRASAETLPPVVDASIPMTDEGGGRLNPSCGGGGGGKHYGDRVGAGGNEGEARDVFSFLPISPRIAAEFPAAEEGSALAATRGNRRRSGFSSLFFSMLKPLKVEYQLPFLVQPSIPLDDETVDEPFGLGSSDCSLTDEGLESLTHSLTSGVGVVETEEHVFIPHYELLKEGRSRAEVILSTVRAVCSGLNLSVLSAPPDTIASCRKCDEGGADETKAADPSPCGRSGRADRRHTREGGVGLSQSSSTNEDTKSVSNVGTIIASEEDDCFTFGVVSTSYPLFPTEDQDKSDCKVAARLLFNAEKGVMLISAEDEVKKYMNKPLKAGTPNGRAEGGKGARCSFERSNIGVSRDSAVQERPQQAQQKGIEKRQEEEEGEETEGLLWRYGGNQESGTLDATLVLPSHGTEKDSTRDRNAFYEEDGSVSRCTCTQQLITKDARGVDYSRYHAHKLYHHCKCCDRRPASFLCLHCLTALCPSHVTRHYNDSIPAVGKSKRGASSVCETMDDEETGRNAVGACSLFINILDIMTSFDRVYWCEPCQSFTWRYTEVYDPLVDQLAATRGTYLEDPVRDIACVGYEVQIKCYGEAQPSFCGRTSAHSSVLRDRPLVNRNALQTDIALFYPPNAGQDVTPTEGGSAAISGTIECGLGSPRLVGSASPLPRCSAMEDTLHVGVTAPKLISLGAKVQGWRATQEDAEAAFVISIPCLSDTPDTGADDDKAEETIAARESNDAVAMAVFCVFDGHGGDAVAKLAASRFESHLRKAVCSVRHDEAEASAVLRRVDQESTTPQYSVSEASPLRPRESGCFPQLSSNDVNSGAALGDVGVRSVSNVTVEMVRQLTEGSADKSVARGSAADHSETSDTCHGLSASPTVSRREMEALRLYFAGIMEEALLSLDDELRSSDEGRRGDYNCTGCTACVVGITTNFILCANIGDSGAAFYTPQDIVPISITHRTTDPGERARINAAGYTLVEHRIEGLLAVSRALGDYDFKQCGGRGPREQAVTAVPDVTIMPVPPAAAVGRWGVVVACDGVWDTLTPHQVHHAIMNTPNDLEVASSATEVVIRAREMAYASQKEGDKSHINTEKYRCGADGERENGGSKTVDNVWGGKCCHGGASGASIDALLLTSAAGIFAQCVAPVDNEEGVGMDNCSLFLIEQR
ncbi:protein phosphatase 2C, putative [Trypanosoma equiperdum]|nr:protein phosphatase 2C, putative [Trypanosoma equiperdum]